MHLMALKAIINDVVQMLKAKDSETCFLVIFKSQRAWK